MISYTMTGRRNWSKFVIYGKYVYSIFDLSKRMVACSFKNMTATYIASIPPPPLYQMDITYVIIEVKCM